MDLLNDVHPLSLIFNRGGRALSILIYHRVHAQTDLMNPQEVTSKLFDKQMSICSRFFTFLPLSQAIEELYNGTLKTGSLCITFDDGYADNEQVALPILKTRKINATFFVSTGYLENGIMWNDKVIEGIRAISTSEIDLSRLNMGTCSLGNWEEKRGIANRIIGYVKHKDKNEREDIADWIAGLSGEGVPDNLMMKRSQVKVLAENGMSVGAHTITHPILTRINKKSARLEIEQGKEELEAIVGSKVSLFAYPNGKPGEDYNEEHVDLVKAAGFDAAVSTIWGVSRNSTDRYQMRRFTPWDKNRWKFLIRLIGNYRTKDTD